MDSIVAEYLRKFPDTPSTTLSRTIYNKHPNFYKDIDTVRSKIRYLRGAKGTNSRTNNEKEFFGQVVESKYGIPSADPTDYYPYYLPDTAKNILLLSDIHVPYHDVRAIEVALDWGVKHEVDTVFLNGDIADFYTVSKYSHDPRARNFKGEIEMIAELIKAIKKALPNAQIYYKIGNHEERYENFLKANAPELFDVAAFQLHVIMNLEALGVIHISDKRIVYAGKLAIVHGHEFGGISSGVNPARSLMLKAKQSAIMGHLHKSSDYSTKNLEGKLATTWSTGCLCSLVPEYCRVNEWNHGFASIKIDEDGDFKVFNARIYDGKMM